MSQFDDLIKKLLGGQYPTHASGNIPVEKPSVGMSQETMDAFKELRGVLENAAKRDMPRKSFEGVDFEDVKQATPGLTVDAFAPVGSLGLMPDIAGRPKESKRWGAQKDEDLWSMIRRGLL